MDEETASPLSSHYDARAGASIIPQCAGNNSRPNISGFPPAEAIREQRNAMFRSSTRYVLITLLNARGGLIGVDSAEHSPALLS